MYISGIIPKQFELRFLILCKKLWKNQFMIADLILVALCVFVMWILLRAPRTPEYLLLIPIIIYSNAFGFIEVGSLNIKGFLDTRDYAFISIILLSIRFLNRYEKQVRANANETYLIIFKIFLIYLFTILIYSLFTYWEPLSSVKVFRMFFRYVSFFFFLVILERLSDKQIFNFISLLEKITIILLVLYLIQVGIGVTIFQAKAYNIQYTQGVAIERNFSIAPEFATLFFLNYLLRKKISLWHIFVIILMFISVAFSFSRHSIIGYVVLFIIAIFFRRLLYKGEKRRFAVQLGILLTLFISTFVFVNYFNLHYEHLLQRIDTDRGVAITQGGSWVMRIAFIQKRMEDVAEINPVMGLGYLDGEASVRYYPDLAGFNYWDSGQFLVGDQSWGSIITMLGYLGGILLIVVIAYIPIRRLMNLNQDNEKMVLSISLSLILLYALILGSFFSLLLINSALSISFQLALLYRLQERVVQTVKTNG